MKIGVYGLGRFGGFWAQALSSFHQVLGYSRTLRSDLPKGVQWCEFQRLGDQEAVVMSVAISAMEESLKKLAPILKPGALVMDTCSVKAEPAALMRSILPETVSIIATHPMFGPDSARNGLKNLPLVMCPVRCSDDVFGYWLENFKTMGLNVFVMTPEEHDREAAYTQGITHFIGRVLADMDLKPSSISTLGYSRLLEVMTQTCNDSLQLFKDLQKRNPYTEKMRADLSASLAKIMEMLKD
ncbi:MAG: prephenate dehydrogenase/arogenate dehydrogenase family protein [Spirochaetales bacterium]|nr:prephenate dehydrogenase/arogenate dehydrogenase family protein [Spirochaetales bacterium]